MKSVALFVLVTIFVAVNSLPDPEPGVHRVTGKLVTRIHRIKIPVTRKDGSIEQKTIKVPDLPTKGGNSKCKKGLVTGVVAGLNSAIQKGTGGIADTFGANKKKTGLIGNIFGGAEKLINGVAGGINQAASDFFCGFNRVFNKLGSGINKGDLIGGVVNGLDTFVTGAGSFFGNLGTNAIGAVQGGITNVLKGRQGEKPKSKRSK